MLWDYDSRPAQDKCFLQVDDLLLPHRYEVIFEERLLDLLEGLEDVAAVEDVHVGRLDFEVEVVPYLVDLLLDQLVTLDLVNILLQVALLALHGLNRLLHDCQPIDVAVSLAQVLVVAGLDLVTELDMLPLNQVTEDGEVSS